MWSRQISSCSHTAVHIWHTGMWFRMKINCVGTKCTVVKLKMNRFLEAIFPHSRASAWAWSFTRPFSENTAFSRRSVGEGRDMPTPVVGSLLLPQIRTWTPSLTAMVRGPSRGRYSEPRLMKKLGPSLVLLQFASIVSFRGLVFRESPSVGGFWRVRAHHQTWWSRKSTSLEGLKTQWHPPHGSILPIVHVLINIEGRSLMLICS